MHIDRKVTGEPDKEDVRMSTFCQKSRKNSIKFQYEGITKDPKKSERKKKAECRVCFYSKGRIGGCAITTTPCTICGKKMTFESTCTDKHCHECAMKHKLCRHCGAEMD